MADLSEIKEYDSSDEDIDKRLMFIQKLKEHKIVFNKSQVPQIKAEKDAALIVLVQQYEDIFNVSITVKQLLKKLSNMKNEIKKKFDGNRPIYKPWEKLLLEILDVPNNPFFKTPGAACNGTPKKKMKISNKLPETNETKALSTDELKRLVLLEQLKLCRMQQEEILRRRQDSDEILLQTSSVVIAGKANNS